MAEAGLSCRRRAMPPLTLYPLPARQGAACARVSGVRNGHRLFGTRLRPSVFLPAECLSFLYPKSEERLNRTPRDEIAAILVDANKILAELLRDYEIDDERRAAG